MKSVCCFVAVLLSSYITPACIAQNQHDSVLVLPISISAPAGAKKLGTIKAGNNATKTKCDYEALIRSAKEQAREIGGNIVKITQLIEPVFISKCYSIKADIYYTGKLPDYSTATATNNNAVTGRNYALLCIYRLADTLVIIGGAYKLHVNKDSVLCTVRSRSRDSVKLYNTGKITLWGKIEKREELTLVVKPGETYYIRCGVRKGEIRMIPVIELVDKKTGKREYGKIKRVKKDMDVSYLKQIH